MKLIKLDCGTLGDTPLGNETLTIGVFASRIRVGLTIGASGTNVGTLAASTIAAGGVTSITTSSVTSAFREQPFLHALNEWN